MTEWHPRSDGPEATICWHVEKKGVCAHSQLKSSFASEAAAMIEGLMRHDASPEIRRNYTDTHGASVAAFASDPYPV